MPMSDPENYSLSYMSGSANSQTHLEEPLLLPPPAPAVPDYPQVAQSPSYHDLSSSESNGSFAASSSSYSSSSPHTSPPPSQVQGQQILCYFPTVPIDRQYLQNLDIVGASIAPYPAFPIPDASRSHKKHQWPGQLSIFGIKQSKKYPELHPILALGVPIIYDVRKRPRESIQPDIYERFRGYAATASFVQRLRIVSTDFPWEIDIAVDEDGGDDYSFKRRYGGRTGKGERRRDLFVSVADVWKALHEGLQEPVEQGEWAIAKRMAADNTKGNKSNSLSARMLRAQERRKMSGDRDDKIRRVDWLGQKTSFIGFLRDEQTVKEVSLPGQRRDEEDVDVWVAKFAAGGD